MFMIHRSKITIPVAATAILCTSKRMEGCGNPLFANELNIHPSTKLIKNQNDMVKCVRASESKPMTEEDFAEVSKTVKHSNSGNVNIIST